MNRSKCARLNERMAANFIAKSVAVCSFGAVPKRVNILVLTELNIS